MALATNARSNVRENEKAVSENIVECTIVEFTMVVANPGRADEAEACDNGLETAPAEAMRTATVNAAKQLGAEREIGKIREGMLADLVVVDGDPLEDVMELINVSGVMVNGRYWRMAELL